MFQHSTADTKTDIEAMLIRGLVPITSNESALIELGFARRHPHVVSGYKSMLWERSVDCREGRFTEAGLRRTPLTQRALLL